METRPTNPADALPRIRTILGNNGRCRLTVTGTSMVPFLRHRKDAVILAPLPEKIRRGDIIFYMRGEAFPVLHRVMKVGKSGTLQFCGDAQTMLEAVEPTQLVGIADRIIRGEKEFSANAPVWRLLSLLWMLLRPVRPYVFRLASLIRRPAEKKHSNGGPHD